MTKGLFVKVDPEDYTWLSQFRWHCKVNKDAVFEPLRDEAYFKGFQVHPELHTITWPNGADFAPEFLYEKVRVPA